MQGNLLMYIVVVCNGDMDLAIEKFAVLLWYEAWFVHFDFKWGRALSRNIDITKDYVPNERDIKRKIDLKHRLGCRARGAWPDCVSYDKDMKLWDANN
jgi:hypothetical protein